MTDQRGTGLLIAPVAPVLRGRIGPGSTLRTGPGQSLTSPCWSLSSDPFSSFPCKNPKPALGGGLVRLRLRVLVGLSHALRGCAELSVGRAGRTRPGAAAVRDARDLAAASPIRPVRL